MDYQELLQKRNQSGTFNDMLGIRTTDISEGYARTEMLIESKHHNINGSVHGGCIFSLADATAGSAAYSHGDTMTTLSGNINFLRPAIGVRKLIGKAREVKHGNAVSVIDVEISDEVNFLIAKCTFTFFNIS